MARLDEASQVEMGFPYDFYPTVRQGMYGSPPPCVSHAKFHLQQHAVGHLPAADTLAIQPSNQILAVGFQIEFD